MAGMTYSKNLDILDGVELPTDKEINAFTRRINIKAGQREKGYVKLGPERYKEVYDQCFGPIRGKELEKMLAEKYDVKPSTIKAIANNGEMNARKPGANKIVSDDEHKKNIEIWRSKYMPTYEIWSPGPEWLELYDETNAGQASNIISLIPPSVVYDCRFNHYGDREYVIKVTEPYITFHKGIPGHVWRNKFPYLTTEKSKKYEFNTVVESADFIEGKFGKAGNKSNFYRWYERGICWKGKFAGWVFVAKYPSIL